MEVCNELYHSGVKGMKWGVRRYQNKDGSLTPAGKKRYSDKEIRQDRDSISEELASKGSRSLTGDAKKAYQDNRKIEKRINHLLDNYEFDGDDGGGGKTAADRKAGAEYMKLSEQYEFNNHIIETQRRAQVSQKLVEKYGEKRINQFETSSNIKTGAAVVAVVAAAPVAIVASGVVFVGGTVAAGGYVGYKAIKNKVAKRKESRGKNTEDKK